jgi:DNA invertase Pin-like site-specific DNA recombinase
MGKRIVIYARVSTADKGQVVESQLEPVRAYIASRAEWKGREVEELVDVGYSGARDRRPALNRLMAAVRTGTVAAVVVYKLDRFGRSLQHLMAGLREFKAWETEFVSVTERIETDSPQGQLMFHLLAAFAEFEKGLIAERVLNGMAYARKHGTKSQREKGPDGKPIGRPRVIVDREAVRRDREAGLSIRKLVAKHGIGMGTVRRILAP